MTLPANFQAASEAAEAWLSTVALVAHFGPSKSVEPLYELLMPGPKQQSKPRKRRPWNLLDDYNQHIETIDKAIPMLATVTDGPVSWEHARGWSAIARVPLMVKPERWSSGHEASTGITGMALDMLVSPIVKITDPTPGKQRQLARQLLGHCWKALVLPLDEVADLQERIRRERAALLLRRVDWTPFASVSVWAKHFGVSSAIMAEMLKRGEVRHNKRSTKSYQIAVDDLPVMHQATYRGGMK
jgi:hypothetical protein